MRAVLISCFHYYEQRLKYVEAYLKSKGYEVTYITTDYDTVLRQPVQLNQEGAIQLAVLPYKRNLSFERLYSHAKFARDVRKAVENLAPQVIFCMMPPNALGYQLRRYKEKHPDVCLLFDIYDMWPESFPNSRLKFLRTLPFYLWKNLRDQALAASDGFTYECKWYSNYLNQETLKKRPHAPFYLAQDSVEAIEFPAKNFETIRFLYLGSINNVIDIDLIVRFLKLMNTYRPVHLDIIGGGENEQLLLKGLEEAKIAYKSHGMLFDDESKRQIIKEVDYALNTFKETSTVGLTMKSVDYFKYGLPIINTIPGDTEEWLKQYGFGYQISREGLEDLCQDLLKVTDEDWRRMSDQSRKLFEEYFTAEQVKKKIALFLERVVPHD
ncbi:hypothetical protein D3H64_03310 [Atopobacter sp. AH10]|uniref:hypothetical protein n=1 Tax=Atopobacter sp. AH10 TaxID=2315861 RepID=UPI000EF1B2F0|nr:hypothetical protein [Atopobacter sp. AH10]RLK63646.1 hypothetical protein D3H64_03310 [Atopobacter sp. AH10]